MRHSPLRVWLVCVFLIPTIGLRNSAFAHDSIPLPNWPAMGVPIISYTPETSWEFGAAAQGYFRLPNAMRTSIVQLDGAWSLKQQWYINAQGTVYFCSGPSQIHWLLLFRGGYRNYPDTYYGVGNNPTLAGTYARSGTNYNSRRGYAFIQPLICLNSDWAFGPHLDYLYEQSDINLNGQSAVSVAGIGLTAQYDTRDVTYYPARGIFFKYSFTHYFRNFFRSAIDLRQFIPLPHNLIIAWQFRSDWAMDYYGGMASVPYRLLPTIGGQDLLRGIPRNMFCDNLSLALQAEFRFPIVWLLRGVVFAGVGDVYNTSAWQWTVPKAGYGLGLRLTLNNAQVNIRFDVARNTIYPSWSDSRGYAFYLTATESF